jgi:hypothetical protein
VTVPPEPADQATAEATAPPAGTKHKRHKTPVTANTDQGTSTSQTGPITTAVEPSTSTSTSSCDANGDGVTDVGAPSTCTTDGTVTTGVEQPATIAPATTTYVAPKKHQAAPKKQLTRRRAQAR